MDSLHLGVVSFTFCIQKNYFQVTYLDYSKQIVNHDDWQQFGNVKPSFQKTKSEKIIDQF